jgi:DNA-3-methyladenine glycosylase I
MQNHAQMKRCSWAQSPLAIAYHDAEWGVPQHDDRLLFEFLLLEGAQAGLSWETILKKREGYRKAFDSFDPAIVSGYDQRKVGELLADSGIVRNRLKIAAAVANARSFLIIQQEFGSFDAYIWRFVDGRPIQHQRKADDHPPARSVESDAMSSDLKRRGFKFVGTTICYAFMQAVGLVNDHQRDCFCYARCQIPGVTEPSPGKASGRAKSSAAKSQGRK